jgi:outer membrane protein assembly factor BamB
MIALGQIQLPAWARPATTVIEPTPPAPVEPEVMAVPTGPTAPATSDQRADAWVPTLEQFEAVQRAGVAEFEIPVNLLREHAPPDLDSLIQWRYSAGGDRLSMPVRAADGSLYFGSNGTLFALTGTGELKWSWRPDSGGTGGPVLGPDGRLYAVGRSAKVYALNQAGQQQWSFDAEGLASGLLVADNGLIYLKTRMPNNTGDGYLYAISHAGRQRWRFEPPYQFDHHAPVLGPDGAVYDLNHDGTLLRVNSRGRADWQLALGNGAKGPVFSGGAVVVSMRAPEGSEQFWQLSALSPRSGRELWHYGLPPEVNKVPLVGADGTIYIESYHGLAENKRAPYRSGIWAISAAGELIWQHDYREFDRLELVGVHDGELYARVYAGGFKLDPDGELVLGLPARDSWPELIGVGPDGTVYAQEDGVLSVLRE